jgi:acyl dehydratase
VNRERPSPPLLFEDIAVGLALESPVFCVEADEIRSFAERWDPQPFHVDPEAARDSVFGGLVACSAHVFSIQSRLAHRLRPTFAVLAGLGAREMRFEHAVRPGDRLVLLSRVLEKRVSRSRGDRGVVGQELRVVNQRGEIAMRMLGSVLVARRSGPSGSGAGTPREGRASAPTPARRTRP